MLFGGVKGGPISYATPWLFALIWGFTSNPAGVRLIAALIAQFMNTMLGLFNLGGGEIILILALILILFGAKKLPELAKGLGQGIKEFNKATKEVTDEVSSAMDDSSSSQQRRLPPSTPPSEPSPGTKA